VGWNVICQPGYVAEEAVAAATDGLGDGRKTIRVLVASER